MPERFPRHNLLAEFLHILCQYVGAQEGSNISNSRQLSSVSRRSSRSL